MEKQPERDEVAAQPRPLFGTRLPRSASRVLSLGLVLGVLLGGLGVGLAWLVSEQKHSTAAQSDARAACAALERLDLEQAFDRHDALVALDRWEGARSLVAAAAKLDDSYQRLADALDTARAYLYAGDDPPSKRTETAMAKARRFCADI